MCPPVGARDHLVQIPRTVKTVVTSTVGGLPGTRRGHRMQIHHRGTEEVKNEFIGATVIHIGMIVEMISTMTR